MSEICHVCLDPNNNDDAHILCFDSEWCNFPEDIATIQITFDDVPPEEPCLQQSCLIQDVPEAQPAASTNFGKKVPGLLQARTNVDKEHVEQSVPQFKRRMQNPDYLKRIAAPINNFEHIIDSWIMFIIFDLMKMVDRGRYSIPIYGWAGFVAGYDTWNMNRRQFDKRRQAVLDEAVRRNTHGDKNWLTKFLVDVDKFDDKNVWNILHITKPKQKVYDPAMDSEVVMFKRINPFHKKVTVDNLLKRMSDKKHQNIKKYIGIQEEKQNAEGKRVKEADFYIRQMLAKRKEFDQREAVFAERRRKLVFITDEKQRLIERRRIEKDEEKLQGKEELIKVHDRSIIQRIQEIKPLPEVYKKPSGVISKIREKGKIAFLKLNKLGPDWRDIMTWLSKVPIDKLLSITYFRDRIAEFIGKAIGGSATSGLHDFINGIIGHIWFAIEPIVEFLMWMVKNMTQMLHYVHEKWIPFFNMLYGDFTSTFWSVYYNIYGVIPEFFIILYSNFFQCWWHLYKFGVKIWASVMRSIILKV